MRDAAGERADALHALHAQELRLELLALRHVGVNGEDRLGPALFIAQ